MEIKIYCNYGVLGAEKRKKYTFGAPHVTADCWEEMTAETPEGWEPFKNDTGKLMIKAPWGWSYEINEVLQGNEKPCFYALDKNMDGRRKYLKVIA